MNDRKWTPGPWVVCPAYRMVWGYDGAVTVVDSNMGIHSTMDANLIAAAPDLYEALDRMVCLFLTKNGDDIAGARAALAKARGEQ